MVNRRRDTLRFRIDLLGIQPPIWRELLVPARYTFWDVHVAIQDAMGWLDYHLHEFHVADEGASPAVFGIPLDEEFAIGRADVGEKGILWDSETPGLAESERVVKVLDDRIQFAAAEAEQ